MGTGIDKSSEESIGLWPDVSEEGCPVDESPSWKSVFTVSCRTPVRTLEETTFGELVRVRRLCSI